MIALHTQGSSDHLADARSKVTNPDRWVNQHGNYLYGFAMARLRDSEFAKDIIQETLLAALQSRHKFTGRCSERTWLVSILKHKIIDHFRQASRRTFIDSIENLPGEPGELFKTEGNWKRHANVVDDFWPINWSADPVAELEKSEFWKIFERCLSKLPPRQAQAFKLREIDALTSANVCGVLNISANNLWVMLHRVRMQLRHSLEIHWFGANGKHSKTK
jgi:RNA polymerase sigma-70 factor (ECF subfamily)